MHQIPTIAIVDDDDGVRASLSSLIRSLGYAVESFASAPEFLARGSGAEPACLIADIQMPQMSGDRLQAELLASGRDFPMIFMTAFPTQGLRERVLAAGARAFLDKPADADTIATLVEKAVAES